ncbi:phospholipase [Aliigemmobacter aestuarii]|uniref:Phospholipase n=1 Tax=Aliigemmobacter aestuarii TaxID=1445661 RepID=A0A4S3MMZ7_9RHOB|nr:phospholipase [Gemmobacter aestuarii]THD83816.1 phospholipase [Gemmobacter aestuarii]
MTPLYRQVIFLHGVGGTGAAMRPLAEGLALPQPAVFLDGPHPFDMGPGRQWFSVKGVTEANRPARVTEALPAFVRLIESVGDPRDGLLIGFSQGAIMALHAVAAGLPAAGVVALSGRLAGPVAPRSDWPPITLLHGADDPVMPVAAARATEAWLHDAGAKPRLTVFDGLLWRGDGGRP